MLHANTTSESGFPLERLVTPASVPLPWPEHVGDRNEQQSESAIDDALAASFPASDPPSWNPGLARLDPSTRGAIGWLAFAPRRRGTRPPRPSVPAQSSWLARRASNRTLLPVLIALAGGTGIALLAPLAILVVGIPIALAVRGLLEVFLWLLPGIR